MAIALIETLLLFYNNRLVYQLVELNVLYAPTYTFEN